MQYFELDEVVVKHHVGGLQQPQSFHGEQFGITGACAH
jgi:hypothetical protein